MACVRHGGAFVDVHAGPIRGTIARVTAAVVGPCYVAAGAVIGAGEQARVVAFVYISAACTISEETILAAAGVGAICIGTVSILIAGIGGTLIDILAKRFI
jgi:hypothetical protein